MLTCAPELHYDYVRPQLAFLLVLVLVNFGWYISSFRRSRLLPHHGLQRREMESKVVSDCEFLLNEEENVSRRVYATPVTDLRAAPFTGNH